MRWTDDERTAAAERFAEQRIFVSIVAFRDRTLAETIGRAVGTADRPSRLRFGICHQFDEDTDRILDGWAEDPRVAVDRVAFRDSRGTGWARARANALFDNERYLLQIDAPTGFVEGWDRLLVELLSSTGRARPIITGHPVEGAAPDEGPSVSGPARGPLGLVPTTRLTAGALFTNGRFVLDVPADPEIAAADEDLALTLRAYTHGHDLFRPARPVVYPRHAAGAPRLGDADDAGRRRASRHTVERLLRGDRELGMHGLGCLRTVAAYEDFVRRGQGRSPV